MKDCKNIVAFQGVAGAHSDLACRQAYPYMDTLPCESFDACFKAVEEDRAEICMIPIGNTYAGRVAEIHNIIPHTELSIISEHLMSIQHHMVACKGATLDSITDVYSHPQALMQCKNNLQEMGLKVHKYANTSMAARDVADWKDNTKAALCSSLAQEIYGLELIKADMQDSEQNATLFLAFSKEPIDPDPDEEDFIITSMLFTTRNIPAGLYKCMGGFATNNVNLIKLESYIPEGESVEAQFFVSFEGSPRERKVQRAIEELGFFSKKTKLLGVYPAHPRRKAEI